MHQVDSWNLLNAKIDILTKKLEASTKVTNPMYVYSCEYCGGGHPTLECQGSYSQDTSIEQLNALNNFQRSQANPYSNTYNSVWRNHPNFSWSNQGGDGSRHKLEGQIIQGSLEISVHKFTEFFSITCFYFYSWILS